MCDAKQFASVHLQAQIKKPRVKFDRSSTIRTADHQHTLYAHTGQKPRGKIGSNQLTGSRGVATDATVQPFYAADVWRKSRWVDLQIAKSTTHLCDWRFANPPIAICATHLQHKRVAQLHQLQHLCFL
jgi:hypothetical protein